MRLRVVLVQKQSMLRSRKMLCALTEMAVMLNAVMAARAGVVVAAARVKTTKADALILLRPSCLQMSAGAEKSISTSVRWLWSVVINRWIAIQM